MASIDRTNYRKSNGKIRHFHRRGSTEKVLFPVQTEKGPFKLQALLKVLKTTLIPATLVFLLTLNAAAIEVLVATGINDDPPYVFGDKSISAKSPGITIEILKLIETKSDINFIIEKRPWKRVVDDIKRNDLDGGFHFSFKEKRRSFVAYPIQKGELWPNPKYAISLRSYVLYRPKGKSIHWNGKQIVFDSPPENRIGVIRGGSVTDRLRRADAELTEVNTDKQLLKLLLNQRIEGFVALDNMIDPKIKKLPKSQRELIEKSPLPVVTKPYYIAFSKKFYREHPKTAWQIWTLIDQFKTDGNLENLFNKYAQDH